MRTPKPRYVLTTLLSLMLLTATACNKDPSKPDLSTSSSTTTSSDQPTSTTPSSDAETEMTSDTSMETSEEATETTQTIEENEDMAFAKHAQAAQDALWNHQWNEELGYLNKEYPATEDDKGYDYWWFAHAIDVMIDGYERTGDKVFLERADKIMEGEKANNGGSLINNFFDDMDWMALALLRTYDHTGDEKYLEHAKRLFSEIQTSWTSVAGGGLGWQKEKRYFKNTPTNGPGTILAVRLYERTQDPEYKEWAEKIFQWMHETLRDPETGYIHDGINGDNDGKLNSSPYTYNHGTYIGACVEMYRMTEDPTYLEHAELTYQNAVKIYTEPSGAIRESGEGDGGLFKGILIRYVTLYYYAAGEDRSDIKDWILFNAERVAERSVNDAGMISDNWSGPPKQSQHLSSHLSGIKLFEAAAKLEARSYDEAKVQPISFK